ncbi:MAG: pyridoxal phosphate-dependent aminotransferase [Saprospiraceae bacterium]|nr:pyridoxal phosphate-dependent aminotransferase [Saprospiraceae bacterium]MBK9631674.1 pyridoxal phosphate-dependent aminotransferase [Saprospiraceae bacterium]
MANFKISSRIAEMHESATLKMAQLARELSVKGIDIINLSLGEPDFMTPIHISEKAKEAIDQGFTKYTPVAGTLEIREVISHKFLRDNQLHYAPDQILVSNGAKQSFANLCFAMLNPGDEVLVFAPYWVSYFEIIKMAGGVPVVVPSLVENDYKPKMQDIHDRITSKTRMMIFSSPCNPTGTVFQQKDLEDIADVFKKYPDILVVSDEIYEYIIFDQKHISIGSLPTMNERTVTINGFSKGFSMTGWRLGYMGGPKEVIKACIKVQGQFTSGAASFTQKAGAFALNSDLGPTHEMCDAFKNRRNVLLEEVKKITDWKVNYPQGAFYILPKVDACFGKTIAGRLIKNADDLAMLLLEDAHVALVSGDAFGAPDCIRISYSLSEDKIREAIRRIARTLDKV